MEACVKCNLKNNILVKHTIHSTVDMIDWEENFSSEI